MTAADEGSGSGGGGSSQRPWSAPVQRNAPRTPPLVPPLRTSDIAPDPELAGGGIDGGSSEYGSASPGSIESVMSFYASPRCGTMRSRRRTICVHHSRTFRQPSAAEEPGRTLSIAPSGLGNVVQSPLRDHMAMQRHMP